MDYQTLSAVVRELAGLISGAVVERVYQGSGSGLILIMSSRGRKRFLLVSPNRGLPRLHLISAKPAADDLPHGFILYLRSHLSGATVAGIALVNEDRIVEIRFARSGKEYRLVFELFGSAANLILTDSSLTILAVYYPVPPTEKATRTLLPGSAYVVPEKKAARSEGKSLPLPPADGLDSPNKSAEQYYEGLAEQRGIASLRTGLMALVRKALSKSERLMHALSKELQSAERIEEFRITGELILANLSRLKTGMEREELTGYDGKTLPVRLDPKRSPAANAEAFFKKYKKAKAGRSIIETRLRRAEEEAQYLHSLLNPLEESSEYDRLTELRDELAARGYGRDGNLRGKTQGGVPSLPFKKVVFQEWEILIGKNAAGNDYVTTRIARPEDLWLHAEGLPGSHVLVRNPGARDIPPAVLMKAAALAAFYSKGKTSGKVSVTYTRAALVRKPKGAKPGLVTLSERKSIMVKPEGE